MGNQIHQLPDHIANQIAAGEVIQRPASVVKELVENAVDASATKITVKIKDAGKTLIQVIDNGKGMSETDARMAFERHATSKIAEAKDLFHLTTMGFRGEALASIAAITNLTLKTRTHEDELGTELQLSGSQVTTQEPVQCPAGCNFQIKNLFFNVPARRKFLKKDTTEFKHISEEFIKVALTHPEIEFELIHNDQVTYNLPATNLKQRIINIFGKTYNDKLIPIETQTTLGHINGFIGKTELAKKSPGEQYFFANNRFMRHPYFYKAVMLAFEPLLQKGQFPVFFIYFDVDPDTIDVNIHPTKTEIKFENDKALWQILQAAVKEAIGKHNLTPSIDFDMENTIEIPVASNQPEPATAPEIKVNPGYNPFEKEQSYQRHDSFKQYERKNPQENWETLYQDFDRQDSESELRFKRETDLDTNTQTDNFSSVRFFQLKQKYILSHVKSGVMLIDQKRAYERIIYEQLQQNLNLEKSSTQPSLFPDEFNPNPLAADTLREIIPELAKLGFQIEEQNDLFLIKGVPGELTDLQPGQLLENLLANLDEANPDLHESLTSLVASKLAQISSMNHHKALSQEEMEHLTESLFTCQMPNYTPEGKPILRILTLEEIDKLLTN
ncbi:DNA mismatch repair protein MutL [Salinivirga cyanobacteriivorans]|uniref:DNA mismatch repair protein MutL n=1 Tax=Salinivirga cyanobacteriivorans TaxID=1307839 RepID=A0A0S2HY16_9BACT|nr:DNA mismatch repair endonuclease MutL [Salinivirga cyanobacteriivorans]ALO14979.1 DNA mismatch repair protein MutL [Salinivirga cyanobacteriivorans]